MKCPVCEKEMDSMACACGYDASRDYERYPTFVPVPKGLESIAVLRDRRNDLVRCAGCGYHGFTLNKTEGKLACMRCGRALTEEELKPLTDRLGMKKADVKSEPKPEPESNITMQELKTEDTVVDSKQIVAIAAGREHTVALYADGTVRAVGRNTYGQCDTSEWKNIRAISAGSYHTVGLKDDGTVMAAGSKTFGRCDVHDWKDIVAVAAGSDHTVGLRKDGMVMAIGRNNELQCDVSRWKGIKAIAVGEYHTVGLHNSGSVIAVGRDKSGQCRVSDWKSVKAVAAGPNGTIGLKTDGTILKTGFKKIGIQRNISAIAAYDHVLFLNQEGRVFANSGIGPKCQVDSWGDIVALAAGQGHSVGLKKDGTLVAVGNNDYGQCDVHKLMQKATLKPEVKAEEQPEKKPEITVKLEKGSSPTIISIETGKNCTMALWSDGTVTAVGDWYQAPTWDKPNWKDPRNLIGELKDIKAVVLPKTTYGMAVLKKDGSVLAVEPDGSIWEKTEHWRDVTKVAINSDSVIGLKSNGTVLSVVRYHCEYDKYDFSNWRDIVDIKGVIGLKKDGTVVATGQEGRGQNILSNWRDIVAVSDEYHTVGLKKDGTVVAVGANCYGECNVSDWRDVVAISVGKGYTVGLKKDGTVVATGNNSSGICNVSHWRDITAIFTGQDLTVGLKKNGTVVVAGSKVFGQHKAAKWTNVVDVSVGYYHIVGLKKDGTLVAAGDNSKGQCDVHKLMRK